ncbi:hypothetical protein [Synechococcus sp. CBW1004]|uniref:hypothetical protein n=1 Tax=Synechococcus sp. CBW1004 TaxID=1353136 RepID=UPI0018CFBB8E|nr:hypothetical protein [Synechococcus sp. CBW1004]QPN64025.1 hypothetical protein H8F25_04160 [Synechococcus sp. CBW1004]
MTAQQDRHSRHPQERGSTSERQKPQLLETLQDMEQQLRRHPPLEDLGPLFGPEAQGRPS